MRPFLCMDAVSAIYGAQRQEVPHKILTNIPQPKAVRVADALAGVRCGGAEERLGMTKKFGLTIAMTMFSGVVIAGGTFTVTQYNLTKSPESVVDAKNAINTSSLWVSTPVTKYYKTISFLENADGFYVAHFATLPFPDSSSGDRDWFVIKVHGYFYVPETGPWTFACNSDDGFWAQISGHGILREMSFSLPRIYDGTIDTITFEKAGVYSLDIVFFEKTVCAAINFSMAKGTYSSFNPSTFHLVEAADGISTIIFNANGGTGNMDEQIFEDGKEQKLSKNTYRKDGYVFQGWAVAADDEVVYKDEASITVDSDMTLYAVWAKCDRIVHFNANGGVFKDMDGNAATQFDQHFTYGESKPLFTDELTPMRMDGNGNVFLGWSRGTPNISSSGQLIASGREWTWDDDETEVTFYAVWTTTLTVSFYNSETTSGDRSLSPSSLADHLWWSVDDGSTGGRKTLRCGDSIEVCPGLRTVMLNVDSDYEWIAGKFGFNGAESFLNMVNNAFELNIGNDFTDRLIWGATRPARCDIDVRVEPDGNQPTTNGDIVFFYSAAVREELRNLINAQRGNVPVFDLSKVRVSIGRTEVNSSGVVVWDSAHGLDGLELHKYYILPTGGYYLKNVIYDTDTSSGNPYWGPCLNSSFENQRFEVRDGKITERTINFDVFGGHDAVRVVFDPQGGECARPDMWFLYNSSPYSNSGWISIDKKTEESLPTPKKGEDFKFLAWFTERSGGLEFKSGATISLDKVHWVLPFEHTFYAYAQWTNIADYWMYLYPNLVTASGGDIVTAAKMTAANGCRTVGECYALGINPEDPDDDFKVTHFEMKDGKPVITLNHTEDGSGNSFLPRVKTLGAKSLDASAQGTKSPGTAAQWDDMSDVTDPEAAGYRFFKVEVEMP